jgi:Mrp family chromosome partitioning ATPase
LNPDGTSRGGPAQSLLEALPRVADVVRQALNGAGGGPRILFTAAEPGPGVALLAAAAAIGLAQSQDAPTALVEADSSCPELSAWLGLPERGLSDVLDRRAELGACVQQPAGCPGLRVLPAGRQRDAAAGEFASETMRALLDELARGSRHVLLAGPSIVTSEEARKLLPRVDGAILVLRAGTTRKPAAVRAVEILRLAGVPLLGSILRDWRPEPGERRRSHAVPATRPPEPSPPLAASAPATAVPQARVTSQGEYDRLVEILERRIAKLNRRLEEAEDGLRQLSALKEADPGIASVYRGIQGLSSQEEYLNFKRELMHKIFLANLELKQARARRP